MKKILVITQCFPCGSWLCIEKIVNGLAKKNHKIRILGLGKPSEKLADIPYHSIPYFTYTRYGRITTFSPVFGFLWNIPLYFSAVFLAIFTNAKVVVYNGLALGLVLSPLFKLFGKKNIIMYHSVISHYGKTTKFILKFLFRFIDMVVVNSTGSKDDLIGVCVKNKLVVNEHFADDAFFASAFKKPAVHTKLKIVYAGRIDRDKRCFPLIDFAKKMKNNPNFEFTFVGSGTEVNKVASLPKKYKHIKYGGYINEKKKLAKLYQEADVVWGFADTTYLALPTVEALACDTPIIVPKYAAIAGKDELINFSLVPKSIGWLVDPFDPVDVENVLTKIQKNKEYRNKKCRDFAKKYYSSDNLLNTINIIAKKIAE